MPVSGETVPLVDGVGRFHNGFGTHRGWHCLPQKDYRASNLRILFHIANDGLPTVVYMDVRDADKITLSRKLSPPRFENFRRD